MRDTIAMQKPVMTRYGFNIRTKSGQRVDNIQIMAASASEAERRLRQMYLQCEIVERREQSVTRRDLVVAPAKTGTH